MWPEPKIIRFGATKSDIQINTLRTTGSEIYGLVARDLVNSVTHKKLKRLKTGQ